jgi:hypothetical protein
MEMGKEKISWIELRRNWKRVIRPKNEKGVWVLG